MAEPKRYFWLKLHRDFFQRKDIKRLRKIAGGDTYTIIYLKMLLKSIISDGALFFDNLEDDFVSELALDIDEDVENVKITVQYLLKVGLLECVSDTEYSLHDAKDNTGTETAVASRVRKHREKQKMLHCNTCVTQVKHLCNGEIEKEIEKELEIDNKNCRLSDKSSTVISEIIDYLNQKTGKHFRKSIANTTRAIKARIKEGFTVDDFKTVIDKKVIEWGKDERMKQYLRPQTLFGTKFESYLNQDLVEHQTQTDKAIDVAKNVIEYYQEREEQDGKDGYGESFSTVTDRF